MERITAGRMRSIGESLRTVDLASAKALIDHAGWLQGVEQALREANIQMATPEHQTATARSLRDRIDSLLGIVPRPHPIGQGDED